MVKQIRCVVISNLQSGTNAAKKIAPWSTFSVFASISDGNQIGNHFDGQKVIELFSIIWNRPSNRQALLSQFSPDNPDGYFLWGCCCFFFFVILFVYCFLVFVVWCGVKRGLWLLLGCGSRKRYHNSLKRPLTKLLSNNGHFHPRISSIYNSFSLTLSLLREEKKNTHTRTHQENRRKKRNVMKAYLFKRADLKPSRTYKIA